MVTLRSVVKVYESPAGPYTALKGVDLEIVAGEFAAVIGKSGSGKSWVIFPLLVIYRMAPDRAFAGRE